MPLERVRRADGQALAHQVTFLPSEFDVDLQEALTEKGRAVFWSAEADKKFEKRLRKAGFELTAVPAKTHERAKRAAYLLYIADKG